MSYFRSNSLYKEDTDQEKPDPYSTVINNDFVLCRDKDGKPTAIFGECIWDFNPYRSSEKQISKMNFSSIFSPTDNTTTKEIINDFKTILFNLIYSSGIGGKLGRLSPGTLYQYYLVLRKLSQFCYNLQSCNISSGITLIEALENPTYLNSFLQQNDKTIASHHKIISALLLHLNTMGKNRIGFSACTSEELNIIRVENKQHPVIPSRIYLEMVNHYSNLLDEIYPEKNKLTNFIKEFKEPCFGLGKSGQRYNGLKKSDSFYPTTPEALKKHKLTNLFANKLFTNDRRGVVKQLISIQFLIKNIIYLYTGMRDQEVARLKHSCLDQYELRKPITNEHNIEVDPARTIDIISISSTTTKFTGYRKEESWLAPKEVIKAINVAQCICEGLAFLYDKPLSDCVLLPSPYVIRKLDAKYKVLTISYKDRFSLIATKNMIITKDDLLELEVTDPDQDFKSNPLYSLGNIWPTTSHQYRRSLAFYASSSGFVSLPTLQTQFKHVSKQMTQYYSRNFHALKTIFGHYDEEKDEYNLPKNHICYLFQTSVPMNAATQLLSDIMDEDEPLYGATGSFIQQQKERINDGEITIEQFRSETIKRAQKGEISYSKTLLGGCIKVGPCNEKLMGDYTACLSCKGAIIKPKKLHNMIQKTELEIETHRSDTAEYQILSHELKILKKHEQRIPAVIVEATND